MVLVLLAAEDVNFVAVCAHGFDLYLVGKRP